MWLHCVLRCIPAPTSTVSASFCHNSDHQGSMFVKRNRYEANLRSQNQKSKPRRTICDPFRGRLKPLGWSSSIDLCAAGEKNPAFGVLAAIYASDNQVSLPQFRRFELAVLPLESPAMKAQTSSIGHLIQSHLRRWKERTELSPQSAL